MTVKHNLLYLNLILSFLYISCDDKIEKDKIDCAGIVDGQAYVDECGICSGGTTEIEPSSCMWISIPSGEYTFGEMDEIKTIDFKYEIMKYEVTNKKFRHFLSESNTLNLLQFSNDSIQGFYEGDSKYNPGWYLFYNLNGFNKIYFHENEFYIELGKEYHPVVEVTWFGAIAFARFYGWRLPTEFEWEKAARSNSGRDYPFGDFITGKNANFLNSGDPFDNGVTPVGYYNGNSYDFDRFETDDSPSPFGLYDMAGNVWEWTDSWWSGESGNQRVRRGGSWISDTLYLKTWYRTSANPLESYNNYGFRCVRDVD